MRLNRSLALWCISLALAAALAAPALLYAYKQPNVANALSVLFSLGFFLVLVTLVSSPLLLMAVLLPIIALNVIEIVSLLEYRELISLGGIEAIFYTNPHQVIEFAFNNAASIAAGFLIIPLVWWLGVKKNQLETRTLARRLAIGLGAVTLTFGMLYAGLAIKGSPREIYLPTRVVEHYSAYLGVNPLTHTLSGVMSSLAAQADLADMRKQRSLHKFHARRDQEPAQKELFIVVLGESSRKANWQLYGYRRDTNPMLSKRSDLLVFKDAISPGVTTNRSLPLSLTFATPQNWKLQNMRKSVLTAFKEVGFRTYWLSNQGELRTAVGSSLKLIMDEADDVRTTNYGFWNAVPDGELLNKLDQVLAEPHDKKLIIVHTLGSHTNYRQRYPDNWPSPNSELPIRQVHTYSDLNDYEVQIIDEYDKSVSYSDWLIDQIIDRHETVDLYGSVTFFSDHGQRLLDTKSKKKGHGFGSFRPYDVEIPMLHWVSPQMRRRAPHKYAAVLANLCHPVTTTNFAHSLVDQADIQADKHDGSLSFFSTKFVPKKRYVRTTGRGVIALDAALNDQQMSVCQSQ